MQLFVKSLNRFQRLIHAGVGWRRHDRFYISSFIPPKNMQRLAIRADVAHRHLLRREIEMGEAVNRPRERPAIVAKQRVRMRAAAAGNDE